MLRTRFAPSPTGRLHLGHAYAALYAEHLAKKENGEFLLRFEDIDHTRARPKYYQGIEEDLVWLGIDYPRPGLRQLDRLPAYQTAINRLQAEELVYPCFCSRREIDKELAQLPTAPHGPEGPHYPGTCKQLSVRDREALLKIREPAWRLNTEQAEARVGPLNFVDLEKGEFAVDMTLFGDPILARRDIGTSYHLAVVIDDAYQNITHITRGEDLLPATHLHRLLQALLDLPEPTYAHHRLILDDHGRRLAKRSDGLSLETLRHQGTRPEEIRHRLGFT